MCESVRGVKDGVCERVCESIKEGEGVCVCERGCECEREGVRECVRV